MLLVPLSSLDPPFLLMIIRFGYIDLENGDVSGRRVDDLGEKLTNIKEQFKIAEGERFSVEAARK